MRAMILACRRHRRRGGVRRCPDGAGGASRPRRQRSAAAADPAAYAAVSDVLRQEAAVRLAVLRQRHRRRRESKEDAKGRITARATRLAVGAGRRTCASSRPTLNAKPVEDCVVKLVQNWIVARARPAARFPLHVTSSAQSMTACGARDRCSRRRRDRAPAQDDPRRGPGGRHARARRRRDRRSVRRGPTSSRPATAMARWPLRRRARRAWRCASAPTGRSSARLRSTASDLGNWDVEKCLLGVARGLALGAATGRRGRGSTCRSSSRRAPRSPRWAKRRRARRPPSSKALPSSCGAAKTADVDDGLRRPGRQGRSRSASAGRRRDRLGRVRGGWRAKDVVAARRPARPDRARPPSTVAS